MQAKVRKSVLPRADFRNISRYNSIFIALLIGLIGILVFFANEASTQASTQTSAQASTIAPISAKVFVDKPDLYDAALSPDGSQVALARTRWQSEALRDWDMITIVSSKGSKKPLVTMDRKDRMVDWIVWPKNDRIVAHILSVTYQRRSYTVLDQIVAIDTATGNEKVLKSYPIRRLQTQYKPSRIVGYGKIDSPEIYMSIPNGRSSELTAINVYSGASRTIEIGNADTVDWEIDQEGRAEMRIDVERQTSISRFYGRASNSQDWTQIAQILPSQAFEFEVVAPSEEVGKFYVIARPNNAERRGLYLYNLRTRSYERKIYENDKFDLAGAFVAGRPRKYLGSYYYDNSIQYSFEDKQLSEVADAVQAALGPQLSWHIIDSDLGGNNWLIYSYGPNDAGTYWYLEGQTKQLSMISRARNDLPPESLAAVSRFDWVAKDGMNLSGYLTKPKNFTASRPLIVMPHGGPEARDFFSFNEWAQFFASNGYVVFQPNFRGSDGFGRRFVEAGWGQWGRKMRTDIEDGVDKVVSELAIDTNNIFFVGASYGGYAALNAATQQDSRYSCIVSVAGLSDLYSFLEFQEARKSTAGKEQLLAIWRNRIGDLAADTDHIYQISPINNIANLKAPVLLIHGKLDEIVPPEQSITMGEALKSAGNQVELTLLDNEGHSNWDTDTEVNVLSQIAYFTTKCKIANEMKSRRTAGAANAN